MARVEFYNNFSINQQRWIRANGIRYEKKNIHPNGKTYWIYVMDDKLAEVLNDYTQMKQKHLTQE